MVKDILEAELLGALEALSLPISNIHLEHPDDPALGDYATNSALLYGKENAQDPMGIAEKIRAALLARKVPFISKIEVAKPGFVNIFLSRDFLTDNTKRILSEKENYGKNTLLSGKKVIVEYTDPNPFKEFHIGHLMSNAIGESLSRIFEFSAALVKRANYQGDVGLHIAKALWGIERGEIHPGKAYAIGNKAYEEDAKAKEAIILLNRKIYERSDASVTALYDRGRKESLQEFEKIYKRLGTTFDFYFFESEAGPFGKKVVDDALPKGIFQKSDGAIVFPGEKYGLHTRVFITKENLPTYEAKELGLAKIKFEKYPYESSIVITGNEVKEYFMVIMKAMELVFPDLAKKTRHISHGMVRLPSGKMSSRTGEVIAADTLLSEVKNSLTKKVGAIEEKLLDQIAVGAVKYSMLKQAIGKDVIFDFEKSISLTGDSGPYLQYTHARSRSVLEKGRSEGIKAHIEKASETTKEIERILYQFPEVVERALEEYAPHYIANYLHTLASLFNTFYNDTKIVQKDDPESPYKLAVTEAVATVLGRGLHLLGIAAPERM